MRASLLFISADDMTNVCTHKLGISDESTCSSHVTQPLTTVLQSILHKKCQKYGLTEFDFGQERVYEHEAFLQP